MASQITLRWDIAAWSSINNSFVTDEEENYQYWTGLLFQLGNFSEADARFGSVEIGSPSMTEPQVFNVGAFTWINVVSRYGSHRGKPMPLKYQNYLRPVFEGESAIEYQAIRDWTGGSQQQHVRAPLEEHARLKCLHRGLTVRAILTYWNGENGYQIRAVPNDPRYPTLDRRNLPLNNAYTFILGDPVEIEIYNGDEKLPPLPEADDYTIKLRTVALPEQAGDRKEPGWPKP